MSTLAVARPVSVGALSLERTLLFTLIVSLPLEHLLPTVAGVSTVALLFGALGAVLTMTRPIELVRVLTCGPMVALWTLVAVGVIMESGHSTPRYDQCIRLAEMAVGAAVVAVAVRSRRSERVVVIGYVVLAAWLGTYLITLSYTALLGASAEGFSQASAVRASIFAAGALSNNLNELAFLVGQGAVVALALALADSRHDRSLIFGAVGLLAFLAAFLPLSRSGALILVTTAAVTIVAQSKRIGRALLIGGSLVLTAAFLIPDSAFARFTLAARYASGTREARSLVYSAALRNFPDYAWRGVGTFGFTDSWGYTHGFFIGGQMLGAHNAFFQVTIWWGAAGLIAFCYAVWRLARLVPPLRTADPYEAALCALSLTLFLRLFVTHVLYAKSFSIGVGLLLARHLARVRAAA